ncbi:MAG: helix-turn-helix transcriptional regulator [Methanobrevibacter millerae]|uniref:Helix-turn-helix transcriptional regulator n=1 Tax=Methanobrevibacter millerae TaxID=230361 RepID=A0A8T3VN03_9EURY|nr:helix-turn-helix domain-containing protein [Methanobrevibacter millerae]MBE6506040.1 helix-turn-helix transcriptional regulator [Methanobrevibacter millerae]
MNNDKKAEKCPMELAMELISRKWVIQILRDMFFGKKRFNEFKDGKPNLSNKVLSNCLKEMEENGLISRNSNENNQNIEYILTDKGKKLNKVIYELAMFTLTTDLGNDFYDDETKIELENIFKNTLINN